MKGVGLTAMDSDRSLRCLSRNSTLKLEAVSSFSSFSSQITGGTSRLTPTFGSLLEGKEDEEDKTDKKDWEAGGGVLAF